MLAETNTMMNKTSEAENKAVFLRIVEEGYNKGDVTVLDNLFTPDFNEHQDGIMPPPLEGVRESIRSPRSIFPDLHITIEDTVAMEDKTWALMIVRGTHLGVFLGLQPSGKEFKVTRFDVCRFQYGKIAEHWGAIDGLSLLQQLGATSPPAHTV